MNTTLLPADLSPVIAAVRHHEQAIRDLGVTVIAESPWDPGNERLRG